MHWIVAVPGGAFLALLGLWIALYVHDATTRKKKRPRADTSSPAHLQTAGRPSVPGDHQVPTLQQISVIYTASYAAQNQQREEDPPPSYESVVVSLPPPRSNLVPVATT